MNVDADRLRGVVLAAVGVAALTLGGWWWLVQAPQASSGGGAAPGGSSAATSWREDLATGEFVREFPSATSSVLLDERTGAVVGVSGEPVEPAGSSRSGDARVGAELVWTELARLSSGGGVVRQTRMGSGERHLLRLRCTGPGELLVAVDGARSAAPMTVDCDGDRVAMELTGTGAAARLSFSPAGSEPVQVEARLIALR
ncbi:hypothetical protein [Micromonospora lutea]|uniref:Class F sortase n=1 Tax=Micromonospora lutea TaxID=419825 RepID=A0ABQ4IV65_9ACTN|nr:hypothetical protein [Micromonospora lutea]GIJ21802.1 hypothetical protein Vlu01_24260 [Micromonospora lutea]